MGILSLLYFIRAGQTLVGFYLLTSSLVFLLGSGSGRDKHLFQPCKQALFVVRHPIEHPTHIQTSMTLPTRPHAIFSTWQGTQTQTQSQPCQELKMPTHSPPTPAEEYLSSFVRHFNNIPLLDTKAHPPPN